MSTDPGVTVIGHPLVLHKLSLMRRKTTSTSKFRQLLREISLLLAYEVTRDLPLAFEPIETPLTTYDAPTIEGKKLCLDRDSARRRRAGAGHSRSGAERAGRPYRPLSRPEDAAGGRIFLQGAGPDRPAGHRRRSDAGHRAHRRRGGGAAQEERREAHQVPVPAVGARRHRDLPRRRIPTCRCSPPPSTTISTITAISSPASATPATGSTARSDGSAEPSSPA